jgi:hypothetical protein
LRRNRSKIILEAMIKALFENTHAFGYRELKREIESVNYLNYRDIMIPFDTYESCIRRLEEACILFPRPKNKEPGKKVSLYLTDRARLKYISGRLEIPESNKIKKSNRRREESKEERQQKLIQLILFFDAAENQIYEVPAYEKEKTKKIISLLGLHSLNDLSIEYIHRKDGNSVISTVYRPVSCIKISKREIPPSRVIKKDNTYFDNIIDANNINKNSNDVLSWSPLIKSGSPSNYEEILQHEQEKYPSFVFYYIRILGVSVNDILSRHRYRFRNIDFTRNEVQKAFDSLNKLKIIKPIGILDNEERYTIADESLSNFIGECWRVHNLLLEKMNALWLYDNRPKKKEKRQWLEKIYDYKEVEKRIIDDYDFRRSLDRSENKDSLTIKQHIEVFGEIAKQEYKVLTERYRNTINEYKDSVAEELLEIIYPKYLQCLDKIQDFNKKKRKKSKIYRYLSKKNTSHFL